VPSAWAFFQFQNDVYIGAANGELSLLLDIQEWIGLIFDEVLGGDVRFNHASDEEAVFLLGWRVLSVQRQRYYDRHEHILRCDMVRLSAASYGLTFVCPSM
jgi:hypothetical protein